MADVELTIPGIADRAASDGASGTLATNVYDRLRGDILSGALLPEEKLRAESLRERYGVGNSPIREALNRLSADGLVTREDQKGFRVTRVSKQDLHELVKTRCWLEEIALRESIAHGDDAWEEGLVLALHRLSRLKRSLSDDEYQPNEVWEDRHRDLHRALIAACGSRPLIQFCMQLNDQSERYCQLANTVLYPNPNEAAEHEAIKDAAIGRDAEEAVRLLHHHYSRTLQVIVELFPDFNGGA